MRVVAAGVLGGGPAAVVGRRPAWTPPGERGLDVRRWRCGGNGVWFLTRSGIFLDPDALEWLAPALARHVASEDAARSHRPPGAEATA